MILLFFVLMMTDLPRHHKQQPSLGHPIEPIQQLLLHRRLIWRRCFSRRSWTHPLRHRLRRRRLHQNSQQLLWSVWPQTLAPQSFHGTHVRSGQNRNCARSPRQQHVRPRTLVPRPRSTRPVKIPILAIPPSKSAHRPQKQSPRHLQIVV